MEDLKNIIICEKCDRKPAYKIKIADREVMLCSDCLAHLLKIIDIYLGVKEKQSRCSLGHKECINCGYCL